MSIIETVRREREDLARVLKKHTGIRRIVEDLYPVSAHFIYELLQNAEDTHATQALFALTESGLAFEHDGRPFEPRDIEAITDIGEGTKAGDDDKIGRFGVGFKAVFAYSETPHIWSPTFSFKISEFVLPDRLDQRPDLGNRTRFEFPYDNPKKDPATACAEIEASLSELAETTLLFLTHLESISWRVGDSISGEVLRIKHSDYHWEVLKQADGTTATSSHFLIFDRPVVGLEQQRVAIAFGLDFLPGAGQFDGEVPLAKQLRVVPATPGRVAVFFPAEKETSGLRFHLHAPFVPELSRASIKETPANGPLFEQLAALSATSLHRLRDLGLLTVDLLAVLPNPQDSLPDRYKAIRESIVKAMDFERLTPTHDKGHAPARQLLQAKASLKDLLTPEDVEFLVEHEDGPYQWVMAAAQRNSYADRFLTGLAIKDWDIESFVKLLREKTADKWSGYTKGPDEKFIGWLSSKSPEWHQRLYALLSIELNTIECTGLSELSIVRLSNGEYAAGRYSFFPSDDAEENDSLQRVDQAVYSSGRSKPQQENARRFLAAIGVREVGECEQIEVLLEQRYRAETLSPRKKDLRRFVALVEGEPQRAGMFESYFIFEGDDGKWHKPGVIYLDRPFLDTGLAAYYGAMGAKTECYALAEYYLRAEVSVRRIAGFARAVGAHTQLVPIEASCVMNPEWGYLEGVGGDRLSKSMKNIDYAIGGIAVLLARPSIALSRLVWSTMQQLSERYLKATFRRSRSGGVRFASSQFVHHLRDAAWVPQGDGRFVRPAEADRELLPEGFAFDPGWPWLKAIHFGQDAIKRVEARQQRQAQAESLGFRDVESMDRAKRFAALPADEQERFLARMEERQDFELPEHEPSNPEGRAERVGKQAQEAPEREFEKRTRSVAVGREEVKEQAAQYLRQQYTNADGVMICQVCKSSLPFKLDDGNDYFEKVWFIAELERQHYQNFVALCPNHAAMFQHANGSRDEMKTLLSGMQGNTLEIVLAQHDETIYFTRTHVADLRAILSHESDHEETQPSG